MTQRRTKRSDDAVNAGPDSLSKSHFTSIGQASPDTRWFQNSLALMWAYSGISVVFSFAPITAKHTAAVVVRQNSIAYGGIKRIYLMG
jgi:hypothetical protein